MLTLTTAQLALASRAALEIERLEAGKDSAHDVTTRVQLDVPLSKHNPCGQSLIDVVVTKEAIRQEIEIRLNSARQSLRDLGIELVA